MRVKILLTAGLLALMLGVAALSWGNGGDGQAAVRVRRGLGAAGVPPERAVQQGAEVVGTQQGAIPTPDDLGISARAVGNSALPQKGGGAFASLFGLPAQASQDGVTVQGFGSATAPADGAVLEFYFGSTSTGIEPLPAPGVVEGVAPSSPPIPPGQAQSINEADLQPVVDAIKAQGVPDADIEVIVGPAYDPYSSSATIRVTVRNLDALQPIIGAATAAAAGLGNIALQSTSVLYTVADCAGLERQAMQAAVQDARERGGLFAQALGVGLGSVVGASHYTYSPFGPSPCDPGFGGPFPLGGYSYAPGQPSEVQLVANVSITFAIQ